MWGRGTMMHHNRFQDTAGGCSRWLLQWSWGRGKSSLFLLKSYSSFQAYPSLISGTRAFKVKEKCREKTQKMKLTCSWNCKLSKSKKGSIRGVGWGQLYKSDMLWNCVERSHTTAKFHRHPSLNFVASLFFHFLLLGLKPRPFLSLFSSTNTLQIVPPFLISKPGFK